MKRLGPAKEGSGDSDGDASGCSGRGAASLVTAGPVEVASALASALHQTLQELLELLPADAAEGPVRTQHRLAGLLLQMMLRLHIAAAGPCFGCRRPLLPSLLFAPVLIQRAVDVFWSMRAADARD